MYYVIVLCALLSSDVIQGQQSITPCELDVTFIVDHSGSISDNDEGELPNWVYIQQLMVDVVQSLYAATAGNVRFGAVSFGNEAAIEFSLNSYTTSNDTETAVLRIANTGGNTNTTGALRLYRLGIVSSSANRNAAPDVCILITDGVPSIRYEASNLTDEVTRLKQLGVRIIGVGVTTAVNDALMRMIVTDPTTDYFDVLSFSQLPSILSNLTSCILGTSTVTTTTLPTSTRTGTTASASRPTGTSSMTFSSGSTPLSTSTSSSVPPSTGTTASTNTATTMPTSTITGTTGSASTGTSMTFSSGSTPLSTSTSTTTSTSASASTSVSTATSSTTSTTRTTQTTPRTPGPPMSTTSPSPRTCQGNFDLVVVLDASSGGSNDPTQFTAVLRYLTQLVSLMDVTNDVARVGLVTFASTQQVIFNLNSFAGNISAMISAINGISLIGDATRTGDAVAFTSFNMFLTSVGARSAAQRFILLVTYGPPNDNVNFQNAGYFALFTGIEVLALTISVDQSYFSAINTVVSYPSSITHQHVQYASQLTVTLQQNTIDLLCNNINECLSNPCFGAANCTDSYGTFRCSCPSGLSGVLCNSQCLRPADVAIVLDVSASLDSLVGNYGILVREVVPRFHTESRIAVMVFATNTSVIFPLFEYSRLIPIVQSIAVRQSGGTTNTHLAIQYAREQLLLPYKQASVPQYMVVVTDGWSVNETATIQEATLSRQAGIVMIAVGVTADSALDPIRVSELNGIASSPMSTTVIISTSQSLTLDATGQQRLANIICENAGDGCTPSPCLNGGTCTSQPGGRYTCACTSFYTGLNCERNCPAALDIVFAIDDTGTSRQYFSQLLAFAASIVNQLEISPNKTRVAALTYSNPPRVHFFLSNYTTRREVYLAIQGIRMGGTVTDVTGLMMTLANAMYTPQNGGRPGVPHMVIMLTDGENLISSTTLRAATLVQNSGITVIVVGYDMSLDLTELSSLASYPPTRNVIISLTVDELRGKVESVVNATCNDVHHCVSSPCQSGGTCLLQFGYYQCLCPAPYSGQQCQRTCNQILDVAIVLEMSGGIDTPGHILSLARHIIYGLPISSGAARVSVMTHSDAPNILFYLNAYNTTQQVLNGLLISPPSGGTNTGGALLALTQQVFVASRGSRPNARRIAVVITSGQSDDPGATESAAQTIHADNILTLAVAYETPQPFMNEIRTIATNASNVFSLDMFSIVSTVADQILNVLCS